MERGGCVSMERAGGGGGREHGERRVCLLLNLLAVDLGDQVTLFYLQI